MKNQFSLLVISIIFLLSCTPKKKDQKNVLNVSLSSEVSTLDPAIAYDSISWSVIYQSYETLYEYEYQKRPYTAVPLLAEDMPLIENNGLKYTFKIKKNIRYHEDPAFKGQPRYLKAQDFITQFKRLAFAPTNSSGWWLFKGKVKGIDHFRRTVGTDLKKMLATEVPGFYAPDDHTLVIELLRPNPQLIYALTMSFTVPMPEELVLAYNNLMAKKMVGTGPFVFHSWNNDFKISFKKFPQYHDMSYPYKGDRYAIERGLLTDARKKIPFLEEINFFVMKESQTRWLNFLTGQIDMIVLPKDQFTSAIDPLGHLADDLKKKNIQMQISPTLTFWWIAFNMRDPVLGGAKNLKIRQAIAHAINVDRYLELFTNNVGQKANSIYPPGVPGYNPSSKSSYEYSLTKAKHLLALAGYPNGQGIPTLNYDVRGDSSVARQEGEFIKAELEKIGLKVNVVMNTFPAFLDKSHRGKMQFWQGGWTMDYPDAENVLQLLSADNFPPGPNGSYFEHPEFKKISEKIIYLQDGDEKFKLMSQAEKIVQDQLPWIMLYYSRHYILYQGRLRNFRHSDLVNNYFKYLKTMESEQ